MDAEDKGKSGEAGHDNIPAWIDCEAMLVKMREELLDAAIKILNKEIEAGHIKVNGSALFSSEESSDVEQAMYLINNLIDDSGRLHKEYNDYLMKSEGKKLDEASAKKFEELQKFVLAVEQINMLMDYSNVLSSWAEVANKLIRARGNEEILKLTVASNEERRSVLEFFVNNKSTYSEVLTSEELEMIKRVISA